MDPFGERSPVTTASSSTTSSSSYSEITLHQDWTKEQLRLSTHSEFTNVFRTEWWSPTLYPSNVIPSVLKWLCELWTSHVFLPLQLFVGPPSCGKSYLIRYLAYCLQVPYIEIDEQITRVEFESLWNDEYDQPRILCIRSMDRWSKASQRSFLSWIQPPSSHRQRRSPIVITAGQAYPLSVLFNGLYSSVYYFYAPSPSFQLACLQHWFPHCSHVQSSHHSSVWNPNANLSQLANQVYWSHIANQCHDGGPHSKEDDQKKHVSQSSCFSSPSFQCLQQLFNWHYTIEEEPWIQSQLQDFHYKELVPFIHHNFHWVYLHPDFQHQECDALDGWAHQSDDVSLWDTLITPLHESGSQDTTFDEKDYEYQWLTQPILRSYQHLSSPILWRKRKAPRIEFPWIFSFLKARAYNQHCLRSSWQAWNGLPPPSITKDTDLIVPLTTATEERPRKRLRRTTTTQDPSIVFSMDQSLSYSTWIRDIWSWMLHPPLFTTAISSSSSSCSYPCLNPSCEQTVNCRNNYCRSCWVLRELAHQIPFPKLRSCKFGNQSSHGNKDS